MQCIRCSVSAPGAVHFAHSGIPALLKLRRFHFPSSTARVWQLLKERLEQVSSQKSHLQHSLPGNWNDTVAQNCTSKWWFWAEMDCRRTRLLPEASNICKLRCRSLSTRVNVKLLTNRNAVVKEATLLIQSRVWNKILRLQEQMAAAPMMTVLHLIEQEAPDAGQTHRMLMQGEEPSFMGVPLTNWQYAMHCKTKAFYAVL